MIRKKNLISVPQARSKRHFGTSAILVVTLALASGLVPALAEAAGGACSLAATPEVQKYISAPGMSALTRQCAYEKAHGPVRGSAPADPSGSPSSAGSGSKGGAISGADVIQDTSSTTDVPNLGIDQLVNNRAGDVAPHQTQSETTIASIGPTVLVAYNDSGSLDSSGDFSGYSKSTSGGAGWTDMGPPTTPLENVRDVVGDPVLASDRNRVSGQAGVFYMANLGELVSPAGLSVISVHKSINNGTGWSQARNASPNAAGGEFQDKEWLAVDQHPSGANVYTCWRRFGGANGIQFSRSTDGGATFTQQTVSGDATSVQGCQVDYDYETIVVMVSWRDANFNPPVMRARRSVNGGFSFGTEFTVGNAAVAETPGGACGRDVFLDTEAGNTSRAIRSTSFPAMFSAPQSPNQYMVWHAAGLGSGADIAMSRSTDNGINWAAPVRINSVTTGDQFFPSVSVNSNGVVKVIYYSTQNSPTKRFLDVYEVISYNNGSTWSSPIRVTDVSFDRPRTNPNFDTYIAGCYMGDYMQVSAPGIGMGGTDFYLSWGDNRLDADPGTTGVQPDPDVRFDRNTGIAGCLKSIARLDTTTLRLLWRNQSDYQTYTYVYRKQPGTNAFVFLAAVRAPTAIFDDVNAAQSAGAPWEYYLLGRNSAQSVLFYTLCEN